MEPSYIIFVAGVTFLFIWFRLRVSKAENPYKKGLMEYIERERNSNFVRKKEIPKELFVYPDISKLPIRAYPDDNAFKALVSKQTNLITTAKLPMIRFQTKMSNVDIKMEYGAANLDLVTFYEDNYNKYLRQLVDFAETLLTFNYYADAEILLTEGITFGLDISRGYNLLADIYFYQKERAKLLLLYDDVSNVKTFAENPEIKDRVLKYINDKISEL